MKNLDNDYFWIVFFAICALFLLLLGMIYHAHYKAQRSESSYQLWNKLHPTVHISYGEWICADKRGLLPKE